jgi:hypothetical protein
MSGTMRAATKRGPNLGWVARLRAQHTEPPGLAGDEGNDDA